MSFIDFFDEEYALEDLLDKFDDFLAQQGRFAPTVLAVALRAHLESLLQALLAAGRCSREEVRDFIRELEREALQYEGG